VNQTSSSRTFSPWIRWAAALWLLVWVPAYAVYWGWPNFLHFCDVAVLLACIGFLRGDALLLSSQAISSLVPDLLWCLDAGWRLLSGKNPVGGTQYLWDARVPLWVRLLSLFHIVLPFLLILALRRTGYDRRGWVLQSAIAAALLLASRFADPARNLNFAFADPILHRALGPAPVHLAIIFSITVGLIYWPTHSVLARVFPAPSWPDRFRLVSHPPRR
jgi:hypothetical protein